MITAWFRNFLAVGAGLIAGVTIIFLIQAINLILYPLPAGLDTKDAVAIQAHASTLPLLAYFIVLFSYALGFTAAVMLTTRLAKTKPVRHGVFVGIFFAAASVINLTNLPHPVWFWIANLALPLPAVWFGTRWARSRKPGELTPE